MLEDAIGYPRRDDDWLKTVGIGGLCLLFSFLIVPGLFVQGYTMRVLRGGGGDARPPAFDDWGELLVDGLRALAVGFVYALVPMVSMFLLFAVVGLSAFTLAAGGGGTGGSVLLLLFGLLGFALVMALFLGVAYVTPVALALVARTGRIGAAFELGRVRRVAFTSEYFVGFLVYLVVVFAGSLVGSLLLVLLVGIFVIFYAQVAGFYVLATAVDDALAARART